ncbi:MAG: hypothetical protein VCF24_26275 [Candidatus Latescibacterota bacterium]|jgi:hypothetical protein
MKSSVVVIVALVLAPLALALTAFFSGLRQSSTEPGYREEELGI